MFFFPILVFDQQILGFWLSAEAIRGLYCHLRSTNFPTPSKRASESIWLLRYNKNPIITFCWSFLILVCIPQRLFLVDILVKILEPVCLLVIEGCSFLFVNKSWLLLITITTDMCYLVVVVVGDAFH